MKPMSAPVVLLAAGLAASIIACGSTATTPRPVPLGSWGQEDEAMLVVGESGAVLSVRCGGGRIDVPVSTDSRGTFRLQGQFAVDEGGPAIEYPATYQGAVDGDRMTLTIRRVSDDTVLFGPVVLTRGVEVDFSKDICPLSRRG